MLRDLWRAVCLAGQVVLIGACALVVVLVVAVLLGYAIWRFSGN